MDIRFKAPVSLFVCFLLICGGSCFSTRRGALSSERHASANCPSRPMRWCQNREGGDEINVDSSTKVDYKSRSHLSTRASFLSFVTSVALGAATTIAPQPGSAAVQSGDESTKLNEVIPIVSVGIDDGISTLQESISGFISGASLTITKTFVKYPLDTATVRLQMPNTDYSIRNPLRLLEGSYCGILAPLLFNVVGGAVFFAVKDATKASLRTSGLPKWTTTSLAVAAAQIPYWLVRNPSEVVKTRQQAGIEGYGEGVSALDAFRLVANSTSAITEFYTGYWENILYAYPADVIKFICYDTITQGKKNLPPLDGAVAGAASTAVAQLLTTPLDVIRNRIMVIGDFAGEKKLSYIDSIVKIGKEEGITGLFAGASPRVGKAIISGAIQFATYEETKQKLSEAFQNR